MDWSSKTVTPEQTASQRTKNRFREHKLEPSGLPIKAIHSLGNRQSVHFKCTDSDCDWTGWLPLQELQIT